MLRLVETDVASAGEPDAGHRTPPGFVHLRTPNALLAQYLYLSLEVVTHEIELVPGAFLRGMNGHLCRRQSEDQPTATSVNRGKSEDVSEEGAISGRVPAVADHVGTEDNEPA